MYRKSVVPDERLFNSAGNIDNKTRSSLEPKLSEYARVHA